MMRKWIVFSWMLFCSTMLWAASPFQEGPPPDDPPGRAFQNYLFPPELVMRNQNALGLSEDQRRYIVDQIQEVQSEFTSLRWELQSKVEKLAETLGGAGTVSEEAALLQLEDVLQLEQKIKRAQMMLSIRIRNALTEDQLAVLKELRAERGQGMRRRGPAPFRQN